MKPGEQTDNTNKQHKHVQGESANKTANQFLAEHRGTRVRVAHQGVTIGAGTLVGFDLYSVLIENAGDQKLIFKGPGVSVEPL